MERFFENVFDLLYNLVRGCLMAFGVLCAICAVIFMIALPGEPIRFCLLLMASSLCIGTVAFTKAYLD